MTHSNPSPDREAQQGIAINLALARIRQAESILVAPASVNPSNWFGEQIANATFPLLKHIEKYADLVAAAKAVDSAARHGRLGEREVKLIRAALSAVKEGK